jgi:hypothetical protein
MKDIDFRIIVLACFTVCLFGCTHAIKRTGYTMGSGGFDENCDVRFVKNMPSNSGRYTVVGEVKLRDTGFSVKCHEDDALAIIRREACRTGADVVNIVEERRADFLSSCYRADAQLLRSSGAAGSVAGESYGYDVDTAQVASRVSRDKQRNVGLIVGGTLVGFAVGFLMFMQ